MIVAVIAIFLSVGSAYTLLQKPTYTATATVYVGTGANNSVNDQAQGAQFVQQIVRSYAVIATGAAVLDRVAEAPGIDLTAGRLRQSVSVQVPAETQLLTITAEAATPSAAARIANSVSSNLSTVVDELTPSAETSTSAAPVQVTSVDPATAPASPSSPNTPLNVGIALILGVLVGVGLALLRQRLDTRIRDADGARAVVAAPVLGEILDDPKADIRPLITAAGRDDRRSEAFRTLRTNLEFLDYDRGSRSMVVTSSLAQEGKSVTVANLAVVLAEAGRRVIVIDADLRRPKVARVFGLEDRLGLTDVLIGSVRLEEALQSWGGGANLTVLPAGRVPPNPSELLQSEAMRLLIERLEKTYDVVLIDTPPVVPVSDAAILTRRTRGALLVTAAGKTRSTDLRRAAENLQQVDGTVLGLVLTMVPVRHSAAYGYERAVRPDEDGLRGSGAAPTPETP